MTPDSPDTGSPGAASAAGATIVARSADATEVRHRIDIFCRLLEALPEKPVGPALIYQAPGGSEVRFVSLGRELTVGRQPKSDGPSECTDLAFPDCERMSRRHFRIRREEDFFVLTDLDSVNGTFVNASAERVREHWLNAGDIIVAGDVVFAFTGD